MHSDECEAAIRNSISWDFLLKSPHVAYSTLKYLNFASMIFWKGLVLYRKNPMNWEISKNSGAVDEGGPAFDI